MAMKNSPLGEKAMREEVLTGIKVKRLLDRFMTNTVEVTEQEITDYLAMYKNNLIMPEIVRARHILIATSPSDDEKAKTEKKKKAEEAQQKLAKGGDFAKLAEEYSDCPSKKRGGDLGPFTREKMVKPFSDAAFSQEVNAIGPIVETQFGYHIIQVTEHNQAGPAPREKVVDILRGQKRQKAMQDYLEELKSKANIKDETDVKSSATIRRSAVSAPFPANNQATKTP
jgi:peptidyl-prolyl cis-trans isomerase C